MKIQVLDDIVINKIAAGEVVDRPVAVVRELLDNAVDSGADEISISIERGGRGSITVRDNGCGMNRDDALLAFERHATSKIARSSDLQSIVTYGFRGEALASIAAVSKVELRSRESGGREGTEVVIRGGIIKTVDSLAMPEGTSICVKNLFFNTPARRKFLRKEVTEERRIKSWVSQFSLANPSIRFRLTLDGKDSLVLPKASSFIERARRLVRGTAVAIDWEGAGVSVAGLIGHPSLAQYDSNSLTIQVNGRVVSDRLLIKAIREGFDSTLKEREIPTGCLQVVVDPSDVDVNVHPQKSEVRFLHPQQVFQGVREAVTVATSEFRTPMVAQCTHRPSTLPHQQLEQNFFAKEAVHSEPAPTLNTKAKLEAGVENQGIVSLVDEPAGCTSTEPARFQFARLRYIGQALECYLLCDFDASLVVVDMHAAHERVNFNRIRNAFFQEDVPMQQLLMPLAIELSSEGVALIEREQHALRKFGFEIDSLTETAVAVRSVPSLLIDCDIHSFIKELAANELAVGVDGTVKKSVDAIAARLACHASIRSGYSMKRDEVYALFEQLDSEEFAGACPHGRPVVVAFSESDVERWFGRDR